MLTFETTAIQGVTGIIEKLTVRSMFETQHVVMLTRILEPTIREGCPSIGYS